MGNALTISDLDEPVLQKLKAQASLHGRTVEAELKEIVIRDLTRTASANDAVAPSADLGRFAAVRGLWKGRESADGAKPTLNIDHHVGSWKNRGSTDKMMRELRGED